MKGKRLEVGKNILIGLGAVGLISAVMIAPGLAKALPLLSKVSITRINQELKRLQKRGMVMIVKNKKGIQSIRLTEEGKRKVASYKINQLTIDKPSEWDKKWRIILFDIPINKNSSRSKLRRNMKKLGFFMLQKSVYIHPYPCLEVVEYLRKYLYIKTDVQYIEAVRIEKPEKVIEHFFT